MQLLHFETAEYLCATTYCMHLTMIIFPTQTFRFLDSVRKPVSRAHGRTEGRYRAARGSDLRPS